MRRRRNRGAGRSAILGHPRKSPRSIRPQLTKSQMTLHRPSVLQLGIALFALCPALNADVRLPAIFSDHMVLQRESAVPVWGWADPGEKVTVSFSGHRVALMRRRNSVSSASGTFTRNGRIPFLSVACSRCGASDAPVVRVLRFPRREAMSGEISIWSIVFIFVFDWFA